MLRRVLATEIVASAWPSGTGRRHPGPGLAVGRAHARPGCRRPL